VFPQAILAVAVPSAVWGAFGASKNRYLAFIFALVLLFLEHLFAFLISPRLLQRRDTVDPPRISDQKLTLDLEKAQSTGRKKGGILKAI
jgi:hypothetical protein